MFCAYVADVARALCLRETSLAAGQRGRIDPTDEAGFALMWMRKISGERSEPRAPFSGFTSGALWNLRAPESVQPPGRRGKPAFVGDSWRHSKVVHLAEL